MAIKNTGFVGTIHQNLGHSSTETLKKMMKKSTENIAQNNFESIKDKLIQSSFVKPYSFQSIIQHNSTLRDNLEDILNDLPILDCKTPSINIVDEFQDSLKESHKH